ncbi:MAG TPA: hypothetical protein VJ783_04925 [Pirellulales bacterium]|nr:hypothetical protein [Pirellulales bacterium]
MSPGGHTPSDLQALEAALASLAPRPATIDRDRLMYEAGRASVSTVPAAPHGRWAWPAAFSAMSAIAASLFLALVLRPPVVVERVVQAPMVEKEREGEEATGRRGDEVHDRGELPRAFELARGGEEARGRGGNEIPHEEAPGRSYLDLRDRVLAMGIETWQPSTNVAVADSPPPATYRELLIEFGELR